MGMNYTMNWSVNFDNFNSSILFLLSLFMVNWVPVSFPVYLFWFYSLSIKSLKNPTLQYDRRHHRLSSSWLLVIFTAAFISCSPKSFYYICENFAAFYTSRPQETKSRSKRIVGIEVSAPHFSRLHFLMSPEMFPSFSSCKNWWL